ncbi:uncharacterized protein LOC124283390 [Haliotis rubra]|uniref:uncharacterized protein LOC124283390 n=1 Tax=Haliotis rubra TaxID=36100 RepID=UPI001EE51667|nr:uncharacterized protein LOC124283390 [Haliotis rubra]
MASELESSRSITALPTEDTQKSAIKKTTSTILTKSKSPKLQTVVDLEREKLEVLHQLQRDGSERLDIERKRLAIEERRQAVEEKRLALDEEILSLLRSKSISSPFSLSPMIKFT